MTQPELQPMHNPNIAVPEDIEAPRLQPMHDKPWAPPTPEQESLEEVGGEGLSTLTSAAVPLIRGATLGYVDLYKQFPEIKELRERYIDKDVDINPEDPFYKRFADKIEKDPRLLIEIPHEMLGFLLPASKAVGLAKKLPVGEGIIGRIAQAGAAGAGLGYVEKPREGMPREQRALEVGSAFVAFQGLSEVAKKVIQGFRAYSGNDEALLAPKDFVDATTSELVRSGFKEQVALDMANVQARKYLPIYGKATSEAVAESTETLMSEEVATEPQVETTAKEGFPETYEQEVPEAPKRAYNAKPFRRPGRILMSQRGSVSFGGEGKKKAPKTPDSDPIKSEALQKSYYNLKDQWFGNKDVEDAYIDVEANSFQRAIKSSVDAKNFNFRAKRVDQAIQVYIDLKGSPEVEAKLWDKLTQGQKEIVQLSHNLTPEQKALGDDIAKQYEAWGQKAIDSDVIQNTLENYAARRWKKKGKGSESTRKFGTKTGHAKERIFGTILEGWARGYELDITGATNNLSTYKKEITSVIQDKKFIEALRQVKDINGKPLISTKPLEGYDKIEHPNFRVWEYSGTSKVSPITEMLTEISEKKTERVEVGGKATSAPKAKLEKVVRGALESRGFTSSESLSFIGRLKSSDSQEAAKTIIREVEKTIIEKEKITGFKFDKLQGKNFSQTEGGVILERREVYAPEWVAKNMNKILGKSEAFRIPLVKQATEVNAYIKATMFQHSYFHHSAFIRSYYLSGKIGAKDLSIKKAYKDGMKAMQEMAPEAELLIRNGLTMGKIQDWDESFSKQRNLAILAVEKAPGLSTEGKDKIISAMEEHTRFLFKEFGAGLKMKAALAELRYATEKNPDMNPNEVAKAVASVTNADFGGLHRKRMGRDPLIQHALQLGLLAPDWTESNVRVIISAIKRSGVDSKETEDLLKTLAREKMIRAIARTALITIALNALISGGDIAKNFRKAWKIGGLRWMGVDVTPLYEIAYGAIGKKKPKGRRYYSVAGHFADPVKWAIRAPKSLRYKAAPLPRMAAEFLSQSDWAGRKFTSAKELKATGRLVRPSYTFAKEPLWFEQAPSYALYELRSALPIPLKNLLSVVQGEMDVGDALMESLGAGIGREYVADLKKRKKERRARIIIKRMSPGSKRRRSKRRRRMR